MLPSHSKPDDAGWIARQIAALWEALREGLASVAKSLSPQVAFLLDQSVSHEAAPGSITSTNINPATSAVPATWLPYDPAADATVTVTTSSTGRLAVTAGGWIGLWGTNFCYVRGYVGVEVLDSLGTQIRPPAEGDGNMSTIWSENFYEGKANSGHRHEWTWFAPNTQYTLRIRRGYGVGAGSAGAQARIDFQGTAIAVTKLGM